MKSTNFDISSCNNTMISFKSVISIVINVQCVSEIYFIHVKKKVLKSKTDKIVYDKYSFSVS